MEGNLFWAGIGFVLLGVTLSFFRKEDFGVPAILTGTLILFTFLALVTSEVVFARDRDGRYADSALKGWFDSLKSGKGPCCSDADGTALSDVDWQSKDRHYRVRIEGQWYDVPDDAVLT